MNRMRLIEVDLKQAESRYVAWRGPVPKLQQMYNDGIDIHRFVASHPLLFNKPMDSITQLERQLGKKTGHAANYGMGEKTHSEACLKEMNLVIPIYQAKQMLEGYHDALEGKVLAWQKSVEELVKRTRQMKTPFGRIRTFYGRMDHSLFKEAYAYEPQSVVPDIINCLIRHMWRYRSVKLLNQVHDAAWFECDPFHDRDVIERIKDQNSWNPTLNLPGGELRIPIDISVGWNFKEKRVVFEG